jgi:hypothetical protein
MNGNFRWVERNHPPESLIAERIEGLKTWLAEHCHQCEDEQRHLDEGTPERAYWHLGYLCALRDVVKLLHLDLPEGVAPRTFPI